MNVINCTDTFSEKLILDTIKFWSEKSYQHIEVLLNSDSPSGPILFKDFEDNLKRLFTKFKDIYEKTDSVQDTTELIYLLNDFLSINDFFIHLLEKLKFEGFNGFPYQYQIVYHILYEQKYIKELFRPIEYTHHINPESVLIYASFKQTGLGLTALECIYNQMYFWCIIGAQHPSIIDSLFPAEADLPKATQVMLVKITNEFNSIAHQLSKICPQLNKDSLSKLLKEFKFVNQEFLKLLDNFGEKNSQYFPDKIKKQLPKLFFGLLQHIEEEHEYVLNLCKRFEKYLNS